jgi:hypothetical protein
MLVDRELVLVAKTGDVNLFGTLVISLGRILILAAVVGCLV